MSYLELTKPRLLTMVLFTTFSGFYMASTSPINWGLLVHVLIGAGLVGGGANTLNQFLECGQDALMARTKNRPIPSGKISKKAALIFGVTLTILGTAHLYFFTHPLAAFFGAFTSFVYVAIYTPLKRKTPLNTLVGAVAGALPTLIGWAAVTGDARAQAWPLFWILFFWQLPHFFAIAWVYRKDYDDGGFCMLSKNDKEGKKIAWAIMLSSLLLFAVSFLPVIYGINGPLYLTGAFFIGILLVGFALYVGMHKLLYVRGMIPASIIYLFILNVFIYMDKI